MHIVVDTSALLTDYHLQSPDWQMLRLVAPFAELSLAIPAVVVDELVQKAKEAIREADQSSERGPQY